MGRGAVNVLSGGQEDLGGFAAPQLFIVDFAGVYDMLSGQDWTVDHFLKVEKWTKDGSKVDRMLYGGSDLDRAREVFAAGIYHRPRIRLTIRQRTHVREQ
jgi:hypothetical protein